MAKLSFDLSALVSDFAANGGKVTQVVEGARAIESDRALYKAMRDGEKLASDEVRIARASEERQERKNEAYRAAKFDGWTEDAAQDYYDNIK